jgi:hypothetical protein
MKGSEGGEAVPSTFLGLITKEITGVTSDLLGSVKQDTGKGANVSRVLAELFMWSWIRKYAESKYDKLMTKAKDEGMLGDLDNMEPGSHLGAESRHFVLTVSVSEPVRRFDPDTLSAWALSRYKIPIIMMKEQIEKAKVPTKSQVRTTITER